MGAIDEGIEKKTARRIEKIVEAFLAGRGVGGDAGARDALMGLFDHESALAARRDFGDLDVVKPRQRRQFALQGRDEFVGLFALDFQGHAPGVVAHEAAEGKTRREAISEGPKADALHGAAQAQTQARYLSLRLARGGFHQPTLLSRALALASAARPSTQA